jgi:hypothetical protein
MVIVLLYMEPIMFKFKPIDHILFVWLISHDRKYCWLIYCERKIILND